ncbi:MAG: hypothetical protein A3I29_02370 [Candidatus Magasanikbacteria bacterium RIFCSPLOWO2_02_FULL_44_11]|uniref:LytR/CpsA/Psr regulator C-terminal domain-containing protein n=2 Tax=Candidatus Magasanikiibacteriota TaxID=1752731 RepID=A0A1F6N942_9BACT|nr:MAG: hypothetical protein A3I29_02370 [Candidatus Magasanikbacteria bacterium RIFCSPLOWO2_02_FULL_44_11]
MPITMENITTKLKTVKNILCFLFKTPKRFIVMVALIGALVVGGYYFFDKPTPEEKAREELAAAMAVVSKVMILPQDDQPVLATVTDAETLIAQQAFFAGSVNGDQLLLFPKSMKAVIWSPSREKIINVGPIQQSANPAAINPSPSPTSQMPTKSTTPTLQEAASLLVEIRNGTGKTGYGSAIAEQLSANSAYKVIKVTDATKTDYAKNIVFNLSSDQPKASLASSLAAVLGADLSSKLPDGEKETAADALVILGGK